MVLRIFKQGNWENTKEVCPICKTQEKGEVVLIAEDDKVDGYNCEALQVHLECLDLWINVDKGFIYQKINTEVKQEKKR